jgi:membrane protein required for colicin V production
MNLIDVVLGAILLIACYMGFKRGLFLALASLIGVIAGVYGAIYFSHFAAGYIADWFNWSEHTVNLVAFAITFLAILLLVSLAGKFLTRIADFAMLGIFNKLLGAIFNVLKYAFIVSVIFMYVNVSERYSILSEEEREESLLYEPVASLAPLILPHILREVADFQDANSEEAAETDAAEH